MKQKYPNGWEVESTGGGCQWLRNGSLAITDGEAGLPEFGKSCMLVTLNKDGDYDELVDPIEFASLEACFAEVATLKRIYS